MLIYLTNVESKRKSPEDQSTEVKRKKIEKTVDTIGNYNYLITVY